MCATTCLNCWNCIKCIKGKIISPRNTLVNKEALVNLWSVVPCNVIIACFPSLSRFFFCISLSLFHLFFLSIPLLLPPSFSFLPLPISLYPPLSFTVPLPSSLLSSPVYPSLNLFPSLSFSFVFLRSNIVWEENGWAITKQVYLNTSLKFIFVPKNISAATYVLLFLQ